MVALNHNIHAIVYSIVHVAFHCAFTSIISFETHKNPVRYVEQALLFPLDKQYSLYRSLHGNIGLVAKKPAVDFDGIMS